MKLSLRLLLQNTRGKGHNKEKRLNVLMILNAQDLMIATSSELLMRALCFIY